MFLALYPRHMSSTHDPLLEMRELYSLSSLFWHNFYNREYQSTSLIKTRSESSLRVNEGQILNDITSQKYCSSNLHERTLKKWESVYEETPSNGEVQVNLKLKKKN